jgi:hypothetical protein
MDVATANGGRPLLRPARSALDSLTDLLSTGLPDSVLPLVVDTISDGVLVVDGNGQVLLCSRTRRFSRVSSCAEHAALLPRRLSNIHVTKDRIGGKVSSCPWFGPSN